ncbi:hypothetical protein [Paenibacillus glucanolyticus]|uniref:hypothetical protein n=1 Tax=Paenibacillus glucanolyticus TaxID=59843 RepID=UPI0034CE219D
MKLSAEESNIIMLALQVLKRELQSNNPNDQEANKNKLQIVHELRSRLLFDTGSTMDSTVIANALGALRSNPA